MRHMIQAATRRFGVKVGALLLTLTVVLFATNPEILSFVLVVNAIGVDVFLLFVSFQLRAHIEAIYRLLIHPILQRIYRILRS